MEIRPLTPSDREAFLVLSHLIATTLKKRTWITPLTPEEADRIFGDYTHDRLLGLFIADQLVATAGLLTDTTYFEPDMRAASLDPRDTLELAQCYVHPRYRGAGLMLMLTQRLTHWARTQGYAAIYATTHPDNAPTHHTLLHAGFALLGEAKRDGYRRLRYQLILKDK